MCCTKMLIRWWFLSLRITLMISIYVVLAYFQEKIYLLPGNKSHPATTHSQFSEGDPRLKYAFKKLDPRIIFALVCGAVVCRECVYGYRENCCINGLDTFWHSGFKACTQKSIWKEHSPMSSKRLPCEPWTTFDRSMFFQK